MGLMSAKTAGEKWGITQRRVAVLCSEGRIPGAAIIGNSWVIPEDAKKPEDARSSHTLRQDEPRVRPFLKWAGGKSQLLAEIAKYYPFDGGEITKYAEPFVGGGAVLFDILGRYKLEAVYISDINAELINTYKAVRDSVGELTERLERLQAEYLPLDGDSRRSVYMTNRDRFNSIALGSGVDVEKAALMIFLNRTCFNGLYRVNRKGQFNVPIGSYKNPLICDAENLLAASQKLQNVEIVCGDYTKSAEFIDGHTFVYFDPPYRPLTETAKDFIRTLRSRGALALVPGSEHGGKEE